MTDPIRVSRRMALAGGAAAAGAALLASNTFAQGTPSVPSPEAAPVAASPKEAFVFHEDVLIEHDIAGPGAPFELALPRVAALAPAGAPHVAFKAFGPVTIEGLKEELTRVKADRDFAQGKMDLASVNALIQSAETLIGQAEAKQPAQPTPVVESPRPGMTIRKLGPLALSREVRQAGAQLRAAHAQMEAALGGVLPSRARLVSRELTVAHKLVAETAALVKNNADATALATQAQGLYKQAYDAYGAGQYDKAASHARAAVATAEAARAAVEPEPPKPGAAPAAPPPPTF